MDSRLRGNDDVGDGNDNFPAISADPGTVAVERFARDRRRSLGRSTSLKFTRSHEDTKAETKRLLRGFVASWLRVKSFRSRDNHKPAGQSPNAYVQHP